MEVDANWQLCPPIFGEVGANVLAIWGGHDFVFMGWLTPCSRRWRLERSLTGFRSISVFSHALRTILIHLPKLTTLRDAGDVRLLIGPIR